MEREKADLEVILPDGSTGKVVGRTESGDAWIVEKADGTRITMLPPGHADREKAKSTVERELGS